MRDIAVDDLDTNTCYNQGDEGRDKGYQHLGLRPSPTTEAAHHHFLHEILVQQINADGVLADKQQYLLIEDRGMPSWASIHDDGKYNHGNTAAEGTYNMQGQKVEQLKKGGLYIINGRKQVVK